MWQAGSYIIFLGIIGIITKIILIILLSMRPSGENYKIEEDPFGPIGLYSM